jgi:hypothetical protein
MLVAMVCDPRTLQGMQRVDDKTGIDACGLPKEQRELAINLFIREVSVVEEAAEKFTAAAGSVEVSQVTVTTEMGPAVEANESSK